MRLFTYVVDHDYGFAPNPFYRVCTLATCKPRIRTGAAVGDLVVGTGGARRGKQGCLVYFMRVEEVTTYDAYWAGARFINKRPHLRSGKVRAYGDNIYHRDPVSGVWLQENSLHSYPNGSPNPLNVEHDTKSERVLVSTDFAYWGGAGPQLPAEFRGYGDEGVCIKRGHRVNFPDGMSDAFVCWLRGLGAYGRVGLPLEWSYGA